MSPRNQFYTCSNSVIVLYDGVKSFWKARTNLDVLIIEHEVEMCIEVIAYDSILGIEASRIYLSSSLLSSKIDPVEVSKRLNEKKEACIRLKSKVDEDEITREIEIKMITQYILSRLCIVSVSNDETFRTEESDTLNVALLPIATTDILVGVGAQQRLDIIIEKPENLVPLDVMYRNQIRVKPGDFQHAMTLLKNESKELRQATKLAELVLSSVDGFKLMMEEKIRQQTELHSKCNISRLRWIKAINRVIVQNCCAKFRAQLDRIAEENEQRLLEIQCEKEEKERQERELKEQQEEFERHQEYERLQEYERRYELKRLQQFQQKQELAMRQQVWDNKDTSTKTQRSQRLSILRESLESDQLSSQLSSILPSLKSRSADTVMTSTVTFPASGTIESERVISENVHSKTQDHFPLLRSSGTRIGASDKVSSQLQQSPPQQVSSVERKQAREALQSTAVTYHKAEKILFTRRSIGQEHYQDYSTQYSTKCERQTQLPVVRNSMGPPSLIKSYKSISQKLPVLSVSVSTPEIRSVRTVNR